MTKKTKSFVLDEGTEMMLVQLGGKYRETFSETINRLIREAHAKELPDLHSMGPRDLPKDEAEFPWVRHVRLSYEDFQKVGRESSKLGIASTAWIRDLIRKA